MRLGGTPGPAATTGGPVTVVQQAGTRFTLQTPPNTNNASVALESALSLLQTGQVFAASIVGTAGAGNKAIAELNNPAASGIHLYVYTVDLFVPVAMAINLLLDGTTLTPVGTGFNMQVGAAVSAAKVGGGNQLVPTGSLVYTSPALAVNADYQIPQPWLAHIPPGHNLQMQGQTVNQAFTANLRWLELAA